MVELEQQLEDLVTLPEEQESLEAPVFQQVALLLVLVESEVF